MKLLLFGEGDFSFTQSLCRLFTSEEGRAVISKYFGVPASSDIRIVSSSLDSRQEVMEKYPAFIHMKFDERVQIRHSVNAIDPKDIDEDFCCVVWNHPHLGTEDAEKHFQLLSHFFQKMGKLKLKFIFLSFLRGQIKRWRVIEAANRHGFGLRENGSLVEADFPGYQCKRNLNGKSFKSSRTKDNWAVEDLSSIFLRFEHGSSDNVPLSFDNGSMASSGETFTCDLCPKTYSTLQGMRTHRRQTHELGKYATGGDVVCESCGKSVSSYAALEMHIKGAHGSSSVKRQRLEITDDAKYVCDICDSRDPGHLDSFGRNASAPALTCSRCEKDFNSIRALIQHTNVVHS